MEIDIKHTPELDKKNQDNQGFFSKSINFTYAYKKTERIVSAIYMVTNLFPDAEPIKWVLRKKSSELLSLMVGYDDLKNSLTNNFTSNVESLFIELLSLLEVSAKGSLTSQMNFSILRDEILNFSKELIQISKNQDFGQNKEVIPSNFFDVSSGDSLVFPQNKGSNLALSQGHFSSQSLNTSRGVQSNDKAIFKRTNRQNTILGLIKKKKEVTIKDIAMVIKDCSEKTIQRELISFIGAGILKRVGERRWSKYSLV